MSAPPATNAAINPPPGELWPRQKISALNTPKNGSIIFSSVFIGIVFNSACPIGAGCVPRINGYRGIDVTTAAITIAAMPNTLNSPMVSNARNSTKIVFTTLSPSVTFGPFCKYHMAKSLRSFRPTSRYEPKNVTIPKPTATTIGMLFDAAEFRCSGWNRSGCWRTTSIIMTTVNDSTKNWVSATSGAPNINTCNVTPTPATPIPATAVNRFGVRTIITTAKIIIANGNKSVTRSEPGTRGCNATPSTPPPNRPLMPTTAPNTINNPNSNARCRAGLSVSAIRPNDFPAADSDCNPSLSSWFPSTGKNWRCVTTRQIRCRYHTPTTPRTSTTRDSTNGVFTPCHNATCARGSVFVIVITAASIGPSTTDANTASGTVTNPGSAAGNHNKNGASRTPLMSRSPSINPSATIRAEYVNVNNAPTVAAPSSTTTPTLSNGACSKAVSMLSLEINPNVGGTAAIAAHAITVDVNVNGNCRHELPNRSISRVPVW